MKTTLGVLLVTFLICATAAAQQLTTALRSHNQPASSADRNMEDRNWIDVLMSQTQQPSSSNDNQAATDLAKKQKKLEVLFPLNVVVIGGAVYTSIGDTLIPWPGGGASGCFDPTGVETAARVEKARAEWAKRSKKN